MVDVQFGSPVKETPEKQGGVVFGAPVKQNYQYTTPKNNQQEKIYNEADGQTFTVNQGVGDFFQKKQESSIDFDLPDSTIFEETAAQFEVSQAHMALTLNIFGALSDENAAPFASNRFAMMQEVKKRNPERVQKFEQDYANAKGFFETTGVIIGNLDVLGRSAITQMGNAAVPIVSSLAGTAIGGATGGPIGAVVGNRSGEFIGSAIIETGAEVDQIARELGYDTSKEDQLIAFLSDENAMRQARTRASTKGLSQGAIDTFMTVIGGRFVKKMKGASGKVAGVTTDAAGEGIAEAGAQQLARGEVDVKDAILESLTAGVSSTAQVSIGAGVDATTQATQKVKSVVFTKPENITTETVKDTVNKIKVKEAPIKAAEKLEISDLVLQIKETAPESLSNIIKKEHQNVADLKVDLFNTRISDLQKQETSLKKQIDKITDAGELRVLNRNLRKISNELDRVVVDLEDVKQKAKVESAAKIVQRQKQNIQKIKSAFKKGVRTTKQDIKAAQTAMIEVIKDSGLSAEDRAKFITDIKNLKKPKDLIAKLENVIDRSVRKQTIERINKTLNRASRSKVVAVDFVDAIKSVVSGIDTKKRRADTIERIQKTKAFIEKNPDADLPKSVLRQLEILEKKPISEITTNEILAIADQIDSLYQQGRTKQRLKEQARIRRQEKRLAAIQQQKGTKKFETKEKKLEGFDRPLTGMERIQNAYTSFMNGVQERALATNVPDVFFDMLDGGKNYAGAIFKNFKKPLDAAHTKYLDTRKKYQDNVKAIARKLNLKAHNYKRIGAYAVLQQDTGRKKLLGMGFTKQDLDNLSLNKKETEMYDAMRVQLDAMRPDVERVMVDVYNEELGAVKNYFPFVTDFDAMHSFEVQDMLGDNVPQVSVKRKNVKKDFTESRTGGAQAVRLDALDIFLKHTDNAAYLVEMGQTIKELQETAKTEQFKNIVGDLSQEFVVEYLDLLARKGRHATADRGWDIARRNVGAAVLGFKLSTILVQPSALLDAAAQIGSSYVSRGVATFSTNKAARQFIYDNMPEVRERIGDDEAFLNLGGNTKMERFRQMGYQPMQIVDSWAAGSTAIGAYTKAVERKGGVVDFNNPDQDALVEAQLMVRRSQSSPFQKDAALIVSLGKLFPGSQSYDAMFFQFQNFMLNRWGTIKHDIPSKLRDENTMEALNAATFIVLAQFAELGIRYGYKVGIPLGLYMATGADWLKPEEPDEEKANKQIIAQIANNVPYVSQGMAFLQYNSVPAPVPSMARQILDRANWAARSKDSTKQTKHIAGAVLLTVGMMTGMPGTIQADQILRDALKEDSKKPKSVIFKPNF